MSSAEYLVRGMPVTGVADDWPGGLWRQAASLEIGSFRPESSDHRPRTLVQLLHDSSGLHGRFEVHDRYVRCVRTNYLDEVWKDSCVEFFVQPKQDRGYFNFEFNCGGALLCSHILNPERTADGFKEFARLPEDVGRKVQVRPSLPRVVDPEITAPTVWTLAFFIPFEVLGRFVGPVGDVKGQVWRGNFFKCAEENSHPHWAAWSPVDEFNFHLPRCFGKLRFE